MRVLIARVGRMQFYNGRIPGDERPVGGGRHNRTAIGHEIYNFRKINGRLYGYFAPPGYYVNLKRIDPAAADKNKLRDVLVIFVARRKGGGQVVVGWYKHADVLRDYVSSPGKPRGYQHLCIAAQRNCVLLPQQNRTVEVPGGRGALGQANVWYPLRAAGRGAKPALWLRGIIKFIDEYNGVNLLTHPEGAAEEASASAVEEALAKSKGQGFAATPEERRAIEARAMAAAKRYFAAKRFKVDDVSSRRSYDLECVRAGSRLHVEVKGTTTDGAAIVLTNNEVKHACDKKNACALFILHSIRLKNGKASGGKSLILSPWHLKQANLTPVTFTYRVQ